MPLSDIVERVFLNGAPIARFPVFSFQVSPILIGQHNVVLRREMFSSGISDTAGRSLRVVKTSMIEGKVNLLVKAIVHSNNAE